MAPQKAAFALAALLAPLLIGAEASARTEVLRWTHPDASSLDGFQVHVGTESRNYSQTIDVNLPSPQGGVYQATIEVDDQAEVYLAVTAYGELESFYSNEQCRGPNGDCVVVVEDPPADDPVPDPDGPQGIITGFRLWDASNSGNDNVIDSDFTSGENISLDTHGCTAIEIKVNSYLDSNGPGSVQYIFDGQDNGCTTGGLDFENSPPYAWEADAGYSRFECAESLQQAGNHTLRVIPFDGDNCTGDSGTPAQIDFTITAPGGDPPPDPDPEPEGLGAPGQPYLIN